MITDPPPSSPPRPAARPLGCSLASLLLLGGVFAVVMACARAARADPNCLSKDVLLVAGVVGMVAGGLIGLLVAAVQSYEGLGYLAGLAAGAVSGASLATVVATPYNLAVIGVGSVVLILFAIWVRHNAPEIEED